MCTQYYRKYTCGCKQPEEFKQCEERLGTNVRCNRVLREELDAPSHMCIKHMVKSGTERMERR